MERDKYHHGFLRSDLIEKGLQLLNSAGFEAFSLRKVADMCGVSHAAPYRHFKNKEELIYAITMSTSEKFTSIIEAALENSKGDCEKQIIELGKLYVKFMVENPEHFKFIFLTNHHNPILIRDGVFIQDERWMVSIFRELFAGCRKASGADEGGWSMDALALWSLVHGVATLLVNNTISCEGDYLDIVSAMLTEKLHLTK